MRAHFIIIFLLVNSLSYKVTEGIKNGEVKGKIHFIKVGSGDSILIESDGHYGLVDSANAYIGEIDEVEKVVIDPDKGEKDQGSDVKAWTVYAVINYLNHLGVNKLDFILSTHAHNDHLGGMPAVAYKFVDENTKYYFRTYRTSYEDEHVKEWANKAYYTAAFKSMALKKVQMMDITNNDFEFTFGNFNLKIYNTNVHDDEEQYEENLKSIVMLVTYKDKKVFLAADMVAYDDRRIKDVIGKIDVLKLAHHGYSESSYEFISTTKPNYVVISNGFLPEIGQTVTSYLQQILKSKVYITDNVADTEDDTPNSAIRLFITEKDSEKGDFYFENTGAEVDLGDLTGWRWWYDYYMYINKGKLVFGWNKLTIREENTEGWFYFNEEALMQTGWQVLTRDGETHTYYFDGEKGFMVTGWQKLEWSGGINTFYFLDNGAMVQNECITIDGKNYCFDENGCLIE